MVNKEVVLATVP